MNSMSEPVAILSESWVLIGWNEAFGAVCTTAPAEGMKLQRALRAEIPDEFSDGCIDLEDRRLVCVHLVDGLQDSLRWVVVHDDASHPIFRHTRVSMRVQAVASLVCKGHTNKEIAAELGISESTVKKHVSCALKAAGVSRRSELCSADLSW
ncbi:MAG: LuxR C-terminal-related transcriptional regulator [Spirochaetales bacterium]